MSGINWLAYIYIYITIHSVVCCCKLNNTQVCDEHLFGQVSTCTGRNQLPKFRCRNVHPGRHTRSLIMGQLAIRKEIIPPSCQSPRQPTIYVVFRLPFWSRERVSSLQWSFSCFLCRFCSTGVYSDYTSSLYICHHL